METYALPLRPLRFAEGRGADEASAPKRSMSRCGLRD